MSAYFYTLFSSPYYPHICRLYCKYISRMYRYMVIERARQCVTPLKLQKEKETIFMKNLKKKIITALSVLSVFAFPMSSLAAVSPDSQAYSCTVANCAVEGPHQHSSSCSSADHTGQEKHKHDSSAGKSGQSGHSRSHGASHNTSAGRNHSR